MKNLAIAILIFIIAVFQCSFLSEFAILGNSLNLIFAIAVTLALLKWDEAAPLWIGLGGLFLDLVNNTPFGMYIVSISASYVLIRFVIMRVAIAIDQRYLILIWTLFATFTYFTISYFYLYLFGKVSSFKLYIIGFGIFLIINLILIPLVYFIVSRILERRKSTPKISLS